MTATPLRAWVAVAAVALGTFTLVTNEFLPVGLLSDIASDLHVSEGVAGTMMTVPGVVAAISAPVLTVAAGRIDRRVFLIVMSVLFVGADALGAAAGTFPIMLVARFLLGLGIGGFWAIGASIGSRLVAPQHATRATAVIFSGVSIASVLGVPAGAFVGGAFGWRAAFLGTAVLGILSLVLQAALLPKLGVDAPTTWRKLATVLRGHNARIGLITTLVLVIGQFIAYTYIGPFLHTTAGASSSLISALLLVYGVAGIVGNFGVEGPFRKKPLVTVTSLAVLIAASAFALPLLGGWSIGAAAVLVWGLAYGAVPVALQTWVFTADNTPAEGGSSLYIATFQISVAAGSFIRGRIVDASNTHTTMIVGAVLALAAAVTIGLFASRNGHRRTNRTTEPQTVKA